MQTPDGVGLGGLLRRPQAGTATAASPTPQRREPSSPRPQRLSPTSQHLSPMPQRLSPTSQRLNGGVTNASAAGAQLTNASMPLTNASTPLTNASTPLTNASTPGAQRASRENELGGRWGVGVGGWGGGGVCLEPLQPRTLEGIWGPRRAWNRIVPAQVVCVCPLAGPSRPPPRPGPSSLGSSGPFRPVEEGGPLGVHG